jgi:hypothetical protein
MAFAWHSYGICFCFVWHLFAFIFVLFGICMALELDLVVIQSGYMTRQGQGLETPELSIHTSDMSPGHGYGAFLGYFHLVPFVNREI